MRLAVALAVVHYALMLECGVALVQLFLVVLPAVEFLVHLLAAELNAKGPINSRTTGRWCHTYGCDNVKGVCLVLYSGLS